MCLASYSFQHRIEWPLPHPNPCLTLTRTLTFTLAYLEITQRIQGTRRSWFSFIRKVAAHYDAFVSLSTAAGTVLCSNHHIAAIICSTASFRVTC